MLDTALHSLRSLLSTATGETPHERVFSYSRRTSNGLSIPDWLLSLGSVLLKKHIRWKDEDPVEEVFLMEPANSHFAHVRFKTGCEERVSTSDLAPLTGGKPSTDSKETHNSTPVSNSAEVNNSPTVSVPGIPDTLSESLTPQPPAPELENVADDPPEQEISTTTEPASVPDAQNVPATPAQVRRSTRIPKPKRPYSPG